MLEPKDLEIEGFKFQLNPLRGMKAVLLDTKVMTLLAPILKSAKSLDTELEIGNMIDGLVQSIGNLSEEEYKKFIGDLISTTIFLPKEQAPQEMTTHTIDTFFAGNISVIYRLLYKIMEYNKFTPFVVVSKFGKETVLTLISGQLTGQPKN